MRLYNVMGLNYISAMGCFHKKENVPSLKRGGGGAGEEGGGAPGTYGLMSMCCS